MQPKSIRLTKNQVEKIKASGIPLADFVRRSVDYYILYLESPTTNMFLVLLENWIEETKNTIVVNPNTNVAESTTNVVKNTTNVAESTTGVVNPNTEHQEKNTISTIPFSDTDLNMIRRVVQNPENMKKLPDETLKLLSEKYALGRDTIRAWVYENRDELLGEF